MNVGVPGMGVSYTMEVRNGDKQQSTISQTARVSTVKWNPFGKLNFPRTAEILEKFLLGLKEAEGKLPTQGTRVLTPDRMPIRLRRSVEAPDQAEVQKLLRNVSGRWDEYMGGKLTFLLGETCSLMRAGVSRGHSSGNDSHEGLNFTGAMEVEDLWLN